MKGPKVHVRMYKFTLKPRKVVHCLHAVLSLSVQPLGSFCSSAGPVLDQYSVCQDYLGGPIFDNTLYYASNTRIILGGQFLINTLYSMPARRKCCKNQKTWYQIVGDD